MLETFGGFIKVNDDWLDVSDVVRVGIHKLYGGEYRVEIEDRQGHEHSVKSEITQQEAEHLRDQILQQIVKIRAEAKHGL